MKQGIYVGNFGLFPPNFSRWIALINSESDDFDLTVSRENLVRNEKYFLFLSNLYESLLDKIKEETGPTFDSIDKCVKLSGLLMKFFLGRLGVEKNREGKLWIEAFAKKRVYPVLLKDGLAFLSGLQICENQFSKIVHYYIPPSGIKEHIEFITPLITSKLRDNDAVILDTGPFLQYMQNTPRRFFCSFCDLVSTSGPKKTVEDKNLASLLIDADFTKETTALDNLLPNGSYFTKLPAFMRSCVIEIKKFDFKPLPKDISSSSPLEDELYGNLVGRELFRTKSSIFNIYENSLSAEEKRCKMVSAGFFAYDFDDQILGFLASKAEKILADQGLRKCVEQYLRSLAHYFVTSKTPRGILQIDLPEILELTLQEKMIIDFLGFLGEYAPLYNRCGTLTKVYVW